MKKYTKKRLIEKYIFYKDYNKVHFHIDKNVSKGRKLFWHALSVLTSIQDIIRILRNKYLFIPYFEVVITTKCSLRCRNCSNLMQYYTFAQDVDIEECLNEVKTLLSHVDKVGMINILGGEPLIHKEVDRLLSYLVNADKVMNVEVTTNGTIIPKNKTLIDLLQENKVSVFVSNYGKKSVHYNEVLELFKSKKINYVTTSEDWEWIDQGNMDNRGRSEHELIKQYQNCKHDCISFYKGELHYCPRSTHGMDLGIIPRNKLDYISVYEADDRNDFKIKLRDFIYENTNYIEACNYCDDGLPELHIIKPGEQ